MGTVFEHIQMLATRLLVIYQHQAMVTRRILTHLRVIWFRFKSLLLLHLSFWNDCLIRYDILRSSVLSEKHYYQMCYRAGMQSLLIYNNMFERDSKGITKFKMRSSKRPTMRRKPRAVMITEDMMFSIPKDEAFVHSNITFHTTAAFRTFANLGIIGMAFVPITYVLIVACLPLVFILFCVFAPIAVLTELVGVLTIAIFQSFDPFFVEQMIESQKRKMNQDL